MPSGYAGFSAERKGDFVIEMIVPWYVSFFSTWLDYAKTDQRLLFLDYDEFRAAPAANLEKTLAHSRIPCSLERCEAALDEVWKERASFRYNKGVPGRGRARFTASQMDRMRRIMGYYADLEPVAGRLIPA